jgi:peptidoglycan/LPS O-acetylase OafA/YrhL
MVLFRAVLPPHPRPFPPKRGTMGKRVNRSPTNQPQYLKVILAMSHRPVNHAPSRRIPSLDGLRALSILLVMLGHAQSTMDAPASLQGFLVIVADASLGVSIFFVISGYLITGLLLNENKKYGVISLKDFYIRRFFRIIPAFWFFLAVICCLAWAGYITVTRRDAWTAFLFVRNYQLSTSWWIGHSWSLSVEEQFYLLWPLSLVFLGKRRATYLAVGIILISPALRILTYFLLPGWKGNIGIMLHTRADCLMFGCSAALLADSTRFQSLLARAFAYKAHWIAACFLFLVDPLLALKLRGGYTLSLGFTFQGVGILLLLIWLVRNENSLIGKLFNAGPVVHVGVLSYSLYLWQQLFLTPLNTTFAGRFPLNLLCAFVVAELSYFVVERQFLALRERFRWGTQLRARVPSIEPVATSAAVPSGV